MTVQPPGKKHHGAPRVHTETTSTPPPPGEGTPQGTTHYATTLPPRAPGTAVPQATGVWTPRAPGSLDAGWQGEYGIELHGSKGRTLHFESPETSGSGSGAHVRHDPVLVYRETEGLGSESLAQWRQEARNRNCVAEVTVTMNNVTTHVFLTSAQLADYRAIGGSGITPL
jgi:hypothetical protein